MENYKISINPPILRQLFRESVFPNHSLFKLAFKSTKELIRRGIHVFNINVINVINMYPDADILENGDYILYDKFSERYKNFYEKLENNTYKRIETNEKLIDDFVKFGGFMFIKQSKEKSLINLSISCILKRINERIPLTELHYYKIIVENDEIKSDIKKLINNLIDFKQDDDKNYIMDLIISTISEYETQSNNIPYDKKCCLRFPMRNSICPTSFYKKWLPDIYHLVNPQVRKYVYENNIDVNKLLFPDYSYNGFGFNICKN